MHKTEQRLNLRKYVQYDDKFSLDKEYMYLHYILILIDDNIIRKGKIDKLYVSLINYVHN